MLIGSYSGRKRAGHPQLEDKGERLNLSLGHFPVKSKDGRRCVVCNSHGVHHDTWCSCSVCKVHLCDAMSGRECFTKYHALTNY